MFRLPVSLYPALLHDYKIPCSQQKITSVCNSTNFLIKIDFLAYIRRCEGSCQSSIEVATMRCCPDFELCFTPADRNKKTNMARKHHAIENPKLADNKKALQEFPATLFYENYLIRLLAATLVFAGAGIDLNLVALFHKQWNRNLETGRDLCRFHDFTGGIAFYSRLGVGHFAYDRCRQLD